MAENEGDALHTRALREQKLHLGVHGLLIADQHHVPHTVMFSFQGLLDMLEENL